MSSATTVADALECLVSIASSVSPGSVYGAVVVLQLGGLEAATKALAAAVGTGTAGLGMTSRGSSKSWEAHQSSSSTGGDGGGGGGAKMGQSLPSSTAAAAAAAADGVLVQREQRRVAMLAVRLVAVLLQYGGTSRIQVLSGGSGKPRFYAIMSLALWFYSIPSHMTLHGATSLHSNTVTQHRLFDTQPFT